MSSLLLLLASAGACSGLASARDGSVVITSAERIVPAPSWKADDARSLPVTVPFCRVQGRIEGTIGFEAWLPDKWNGRMLGAGVGGDAGVFNFGDMSRRIGEGFATVTTDSGHKVTDARWMANPKARVDYEHRAVHLTALAAKDLVADLYGRKPDRSYFTGCSGGGRQALKEMQNHPGDYDGVLAGAPGPYMPLQSVRMMYFSLLQKQQPRGALSDADWSLYETRATAACDAGDGVLDGIIGSPMGCDFRPAALLCKPGLTSDCLTAPKVAMMEAIVAPMKDERGRAMDSGLLPGVRTRPGPPSPLLRAMWADGVYNDPSWDENRFNRSADLQAANRIMPELRTDKVDIAPFLKAGGKAIVYQGWADPSTNAGPTIDYVAAAARKQGGMERLSKGLRLFMVPGMYHCSRGPGADQFGGSGQQPWPGDPQRDALWALINWVEKGRAPETLVATKLEGTTARFTRTLCPYPLAARYRGKGDTNVAASFSCVPDPALTRSLSRPTLVGS